MKRAMFIAAAAGWYLANIDQSQMPALERVMRSEMLERRAALLRESTWPRRVAIAAGLTAATMVALLELVKI